MHAQSERGLAMNQPLPVSWPSEVADRDGSPVAACGPRQHPCKITHALVFARPLRAGTARSPNLIGSWSQCALKRRRGSLLEPAAGLISSRSGIFGDDTAVGPAFVAMNSAAKEDFVSKVRS